MFLRKVLPTAFVLLAIPGFGSAAVIDFESLASGDYSSPLSFNNVGGSGVDVTVTAGSTGFTVYSSGTSHAHMLLDFFPTNPVGTTYTFSSAISGFSMEAGDLGADDDTPLTIKLYDGSDNLLDTVAVSYDASKNIGNGDFALLSSSAVGVRKVVFTGGGAFPGSIYMDNVTFGAVPEPATMLGLAAGSALLIRRRRKASK